MKRVAKEYNPPVEISEKFDDPAEYKFADIDARPISASVLGVVEKQQLVTDGGQHLTTHWIPEQILK